MSKSDKNKEIFNEAVNKFFGHNPANPYWVLIALYLRKNHQIEIMEDYMGDHVNVIAPVAYENDITDYEWKSECGSRNQLRTLSIVGNLSSNERLRHIFNIFEEDAKSRNIPRSGLSTSDKKQWDPIFLLDFVSSLLLLDHKWLKDNFNELFDKMVQRCFFLERYDIYSQPNELTLLVRHLMGDNVGKVYDPFAGVASYALTIPKGARYIGEEIHPLVTAIGNLRIMANDIDGEVLNESSLNDRDFDADIIVSTPPFHLPVETEKFPWSKRYGKENDACSFLLKKCLFTRKRGIITTVGKFNFNPASRHSRKILVEADIIDTVISLPPNIFDRTGGKTYVYVLNPDHDHKGSVRFVNATDLFTVSQRKNILDVDGIISLLNKPGEKNTNVAIDEIEANNYILSPEFYLKPQIEVPHGASLIRMGELVDYVSPKTISKERGELEGEILILRNQDNINYLKIYRPGSDTKKEPLPARANEISQNCILVNAIMSKRTGIVVEPDGKKIFAPPLWRQFVVKDESKILPQYLVLQLYQPYFESQMLTGPINLSATQILNALIIVPSIERQRREIENYQEKLIGNLGLEIISERDRKEDVLAKEMRIRRHTLLNAMHGIVSGMSVLKNFIDNKNQPFEKTEIVAPRKQMSMETLVNKVNQNLDRVVNLITDLMDLGSYGPAEVINISEFCNEYERRYVESDNFKIVWPNNTDVESNLVEREKLNVSFSRKELYTLFENIISNADKHGFYHRKNGNNVIRIEFEPIVNDGSECVSIRFLNNGIPLHSDIGSEVIFEWGRKSSRSTGNGIGAWHIRQIVEHYGGGVEVSNLEDDERGFTVMYEVKLPIINN